MYHIDHHSVVQTLIFLDFNDFKICWLACIYPRVILNYVCKKL